MVTHLSANPVRLNPLHLQQCSLRLFRICSVAAVVLFSLLSFDRSVVTLYRRASVTPSSPPSDFLLSVFSPYPRELLRISYF